MFCSYPCIPSDFPEGNPCSTLYITNIDPKVKERTLASFFEIYGPLHTVKIVREKTSGKSLSYGFVEFIDPVHAEIARVKAQYHRIERREILVMFTSERQQLVQEAKIFVKNVCPNVSVNELHSHFAQISPHLFIHINTDDKGKRLNFGFVHYLHTEDAENAITRLQETELKGQKLQLSKWVVKETRQLAQTESRRNLYIRNLPLLKKKVIETSLREMFSAHGEIESMLIKKAPKLSSYYALASFKEPQAAQAALKELISNPPTLEGSTEPLFVSWYQRKSERKSQGSPKQNALYFSNLKIDVTEEALKEAFKQYGKIAKVVMTAWEGLENEGNVKSGYVVFEMETSAEEALNQCGDNNNIKNLFAFEPEIELSSYRLNSATKSKTKQRRRRSTDYKSPVPAEQPYMYWQAPAPYVGNVFQPVFPQYYPMNYFPPAMPMYPNNFYLMPHENVMERPNNYLYIPNEQPCYDCEREQSSKRKVSLISTNLADQETRPHSLGSLSVLDGDHLEDSGNTEGQTSTDESDSTDNERRKSQEGTPESIKQKPRTFSQQSTGQKGSDCCPKRKYGNLSYSRRRNIGNVN